MVMQDSDFWRGFGDRLKKAGPGLFDLGMNAYGSRQAEKEAANRLRTAQGPVYDKAMSLASGQLDQVGNMSPTGAAQDYFNRQQSLLSGVDAKSEADLMRSLYAKGMLGAANYNPGVEGIAPSTTAMNPQMAAYYAARNARDAKMSADALTHGQGMLDSYTNRANSLVSGASNAQSAGLAGQRTQPSRAASNMNIMKGATGVLKETGIMKDIGGLLKGGVNWLRGLGASSNGMFSSPFDEGGFDFDFGSPELFDWSI